MIWPWRAAATVLALAVLTAQTQPSLADDELTITEEQIAQFTDLTGDVTTQTCFYGIITFVILFMRTQK